MGFDPIGLAAVVFGAAMAATLSGVGSAMGIRYAANVANGVLAEDPAKFGSIFILVALPGTQGFYGFLGAFLAIQKLGFLGGAGPATLSFWQGMQIMFACLPVAFAGLFSAIYQGKVCAAGIEMTAKQPKESMKGVIYGALVETYAVLGLLITIFLLTGIKL